MKMTPAKRERQIQKQQILRKTNIVWYREVIHSKPYPTINNVFHVGHSQIRHTRFLKITILMEKSLKYMSWTMNTFRI